MKVKLYAVGGFHNSPKKEFWIDAKLLGYVFKNNLHDTLRDYAPALYKKLNTHFCGISGCSCGGLSRAENGLVGESK